MPPSTSSSRPSQGIYHPTLSSYYPHLLTLRGYLEGHLLQPGSSVSGASALGKHGQRDVEGSSLGNEEEDLEGLLDTTLVASNQVLSEGTETKMPPGDVNLTQQEVSQRTFPFS